jgi:quercetin dioxygenase-like cupin family protein
MWHRKNVGGWERAARLIGGGLMLICGVVALHAQGQQTFPQPSPVKRTPLGKVEVPGSNYEVVFGITELAAGFKSGRHSHPGLVLAYVAEGEFWYHVDGQTEKIYKVGESFQLPDRAIHNEGAEGDKAVKVMAVFVVEKGKPLVQPAQ